MIYNGGHLSAFVGVDAATILFPVSPSPQAVETVCLFDDSTSKIKIRYDTTNYLGQSYQRMNIRIFLSHFNLPYTVP